MTETAVAPAASSPVTTNDPTQQQQPPVIPPAVPPASVPPAVPGAVPPAPITPATPDPWAGLEDPELKAFVGTKTPAEVAKELKGAQALIGKKAVGVPDANSTPEEHAKFHEARGVPPSPDAYQFDDVLSDLTKDLPEGLVVMDPAREKETRELLKAANISNGEARELIKRQLGKEIEQAKATHQAAETLKVQMNDLVVKTWGPKKDEYTQDANNFLKAIGVEDDVLAVMNSALGSKPEARMKFLEMARTQGAMLREGGVPQGQQNGVTLAAMTPEQARTAKENFLAQGDNRDIYLGKKPSPRYAEISKHVADLVKVERGIK